MPISCIPLIGLCLANRTWKDYNFRKEVIRNVYFLRLYILSGLLITNNITNIDKEMYNDFYLL